ncbi:hypothetical protein SUGI_1135710 [Cryptomeria japonica]|nr:hypothetical protein SUGI_1135710 [Cryptomeria japonica]
MEVTDAANLCGNGWQTFARVLLQVVYRYSVANAVYFLEQTNPLLGDVQSFSFLIKTGAFQCGVPDFVDTSDIVKGLQLQPQQAFQPNFIRPGNRDSIVEFIAERRSECEIGRSYSILISEI